MSFFIRFKPMYKGLMLCFKIQTDYFEVDLTHKFFLLQGKYMDIEFDFKGDPLGGVISNCEYFKEVQNSKIYINM